MARSSKGTTSTAQGTVTASEPQVHDVRHLSKRERNALYDSLLSSESRMAWHSGANLAHDGTDEGIVLAGMQVQAYAYPAWFSLRHVIVSRGQVMAMGINAPRPKPEAQTAQEPKAARKSRKATTSKGSRKAAPKPQAVDAAKREAANARASKRNVQQQASTDARTSAKPAPKADIRPSGVVVRTADNVRAEMIAMMLNATPANMQPVIREAIAFSNLHEAIKHVQASTLNRTAKAHAVGVVNALFGISR